jgi:hypothetical protein
MDQGISDLNQMEDPYENGLQYQQLFFDFRQFDLKSLEVFSTEQSHPCLSFSEPEKVPPLRGSYRMEAVILHRNSGPKSHNHVIQPSNATCIGYKIHLGMSIIFWEVSKLYPRHHLWGGNRRGRVISHDFERGSRLSAAPGHLLPQ